MRKIYITIIEFIDYTSSDVLFRIFILVDGAENAECVRTHANG